MSTHSFAKSVFGDGQVNKTVILRRIAEFTDTVPTFDPSTDPVVFTFTPDAEPEIGRELEDFIVPQHMGAETKTPYAYPLTDTANDALSSGKLHEAIVVDTGITTQLLGVMNPSQIDSTKFDVLFDGELSDAEKTALDAVVAAHNGAVTDAEVKEAAIKREITHDPLEGYTIDVQVSGLVLTVNINSIVVNDVTTVVADGTDTKFVKLCYVYNETSDTLAIQAFEKTTGVYDDVGLDEYIVKDLGEWSTPVNGTLLTGV
jgi:hypothetical protein